MAQYSLQVEAREGRGKGVARKLRAAGRIPGVVYGRGKSSHSVACDPKALEKLLHASGSGMNTLFDISVDGQTRTVLVKHLQRDPLRGRYLHADFYEVDLTKAIQVAVPLHFVGKARGLELGGILDHPLRELEVSCLPTAIPDAVEVDVTALEIGDSLHVRDLTLPQGVEVLSDADLPVASMVAPTVEAEPVPEEGLELAEGAAPEEGAEAAAAPAAEGEAKEGS